MLVPGLQHDDRIPKCQTQHSSRKSERAAHAAGCEAGPSAPQRLPPCTLPPGTPGLGDSVSVVCAFTGATVLVTGATGYVGSLVSKHPAAGMHA
jgi:hypothetical protein